MADNGTAASAPTIAWDDIGGVAYQRMKVGLGPDGTYTADADGTAARGMYVDPRYKMVRVSQTPTVSNAAIYAAKDAVGGLLTFANAVRAVGGSGRIEAVQILDKGQQRADLDLVLFDRTLGAPTDNAIFAPSDAELATCVGWVSVGAGSYADLSTNSVAHVAPGLAFVLEAATTSLFGALVTRGTPTYTSTSDIIVTLTIAQD